MSGSAGFQTCCVADFQIGGTCVVPRAAGLETRDTADLEVCATPSAARKRLTRAQVSQWPYWRAVRELTHAPKNSPHYGSSDELSPDAAGECRTDPSSHCRGGARRQ